MMDQTFQIMLILKTRYRFRLANYISLYYTVRFLFFGAT